MAQKQGECYYRIALTDLIDEHDSRRILSGQPKHVSDHARALSQILLHELTAHHRNEGRGGGVGDRLCHLMCGRKARNHQTTLPEYDMKRVESADRGVTYHGLSSARWAVQQHASGRVDADLLVQFELRQRQLHCFAHLSDAATTIREDG